MPLVFALLCAFSCRAFAANPDNAQGNSRSNEIVCWGDSLTEGMGASPATVKSWFETYDASYQSYPEILAHLTEMPTYNFGVSGATSAEVAYMQGAIDWGKRDMRDEIGESADADNEDADGEDEGDDGDEDDSEPLVDEAVMKRGAKHKGDVLVIEMGSNGGWNGNYKVLIAQYRAMIDHAKCKNYIIIGDTDDPGTSIADLKQEPFKDGDGPGKTAWEKALEKEFGEHFVNMRVYLIENGLKDAGLTATKEDAALARCGCISWQLRADWTHLNSYGYYAQAMAVFKRGIALGYWSLPLRPDILWDDPLAPHYASTR